MRLADASAVLRSKNAGIGHLTVDIIFPNEKLYRIAQDAVTPASVAAAYGVGEERISDFVHFDEGWAIKVTFRRDSFSGGLGLGEADIFGSGQHAPLAELNLPEYE